ncbi:MAG: Ish1 domain-containing protein [Promicromonosporaceae bacterium]|nr:Ish1 domain-containing protein [Promicromonosporaceae bacterium]
MAKKQITAPVEGFTGVVVFVPFFEGKGETDDPRALAYFQRHGYRIEEPDGEAEAPAPPYPDGDPGGDWTVEQLRKWSKDHSVVLADAKTKDAILEVIAAAQSAQ